jgi:phage terminase large subunit-like protein
MSRSNPKRTSSSASSGRSRAARKPRCGPIRLPSDDQAIENGCYFDEESGLRVVEFIEGFCKHSVGRFEGEVFLLEQWQRDFIINLFGWKRADGTRRFREAYLEVPKKNGKSTLMSALALEGICEEPAAGVYLGAVDREQASIVYDECANMVRASPDLEQHLEIIDSKKRIIFPGRNARIVTMSADAPKRDGVNCSRAILDEIHRFTSPDLYDIMKYAGRARDQPLVISITTAGHDRRSICYELHTRALAAINGTAKGGDIAFMPVIYAADPEDDLDDPRTWRKANPSMGRILKEEDFAEDHKEAKLLPRLWAMFLRLRLNIWTEQVTRWIPLELWDAGLLLDPFEESWMVGRSCYAALDLSSVADLTVLVLGFVDGDDLKVVPYFFVPEDTAERRAVVDNVPYPEWIKSGHIIGTPGNSTDHKAIRKKLNDLLESGIHFLKVGIDPWNAASLANDLVDDGFEVEMIRQGYASLSGPTKELERRLLGETIKHWGNPVMRWNIANVATEEDAAGNLKPSKKKSTERIDGVVALVMTLLLAMTYPESTGPRVHSLR